MQVQLNQAELTSAVRQYISGQGFNLTDKDVNVDFTAGRGENGLTATVRIENGMSLPVLTDDAAAKPALKVVSAEPAPAPAAEADAATAETVAVSIGKPSLFTA